MTILFAYFIHYLTSFFIGAARIVGGAGSTKRYDVRPSVRLSVPFAAAGLLLWARRVGHIDRLLYGQPCSSTRTQHSAQQQMRAVPRFQRRR